MPIKKVYTTRYLRRAYEDGALTPEQISRLRDIGFQFKSRTRSRAVACYETGETWPSVKEAADAARISVTRMISALKKLRDIEGAHYYYLDSPKPRAEDLRETRRPRRVLRQVSYMRARAPRPRTTDARTPPSQRPATGACEQGACTSTSPIIRCLSRTSS